jgi:hypothetical protein
VWESKCAVMVAKLSERQCVRVWGVSTPCAKSLETRNWNVHEAPAMFMRHLKCLWGTCFPCEPLTFVGLWSCRNVKFPLWGENRHLSGLLVTHRTVCLTVLYVWSCWARLSPNLCVLHFALETWRGYTHCQIHGVDSPLGCIQAAGPLPTSWCVCVCDYVVWLCVWLCGMTVRVWLCGMTVCVHVNVWLHDPHPELSHACLVCAPRCVIARPSSWTSSCSGRRRKKESCRWELQRKGHAQIHAHKEACARALTYARAFQASTQLWMPAKKAVWDGWCSHVLFVELS